MIGERIKQARVAAGLSLRDAAARAELSAMAISKFERGETTPTSTTLLRLAKALDTRTEFFFRPSRVQLAKPEYRKRSSIGVRQLARLEADILDQAERFLEVLGLYPTAPVALFSVPSAVPSQINDLEAVEEVALSVREAWGLGHDAVASLADILEERGLLVLTTSVPHGAKFDGLAAKVNDVPVVAVGADWPGDRQRFTMAHELGHLILEGRLAADVPQEKACHRFAGAFLAPRTAVRTELGERRSRLELRELQALKLEYGLSMLAWVFRARDVGVISSSTADGFFRLFSSRGWRTQEPGPSVGQEHPALLERLVLRALAEDMISASRAAELMGVSLSTFRQRLKVESPGAAAHQ